MFILRDMMHAIKNGALQVPVIAVIGPRQSGKSTLVKELFKNHIYLDMQDSELLDFARNDPKGFLQNYKNEYGIIIDEAQYAPNLFFQIKVEADKNPQAGYYILSGSQNFLLHEKINESLAGRVYFYTLLPFSIKELKEAHKLEESCIDQFCKGFYPSVYKEYVDYREYYENYISTYVERDIRSIRNIGDIVTFKKFMHICALRVGTMLNLTDLAMHCGIALATVKSWLSLLETSFILFLLPSYHENLGKRVTKSPKLYFYDIGLAVALMHVNKELLLTKRDLYGALFENMVIVDLIKNNNAQKKECMFSFFRDSNQKEVDLIVEAYGKTLAIEIKASQSMQSTFFDTVKWFNEEKNSSEKPIVIYGGEQNQQRENGLAISWKNIASLSDLLKK